jgi:hypothetical protein
MRTLFRLALPALVSTTFGASFLMAPDAALLKRNRAVDGTMVLQRMHDAYAGRWYRTLTFTQKTTRRRQDGSDTVETWLESLRYTPERGTQLRIDIGDLASGRGVLYTADSSWRVAKGVVTGARADGNEFLPLIEGVYLQPVAKTVAELAHHDIRVDAAYAATLDGQPSWVVGASSAADSTSSQFTVDTVRKVVTRMVIGRGAGQPAIDVRLGGYERVGKGWLATKVVMTSKGAPLQTEEYSGWKVDVELPASLFDAAQWMTTTHWGRSR